MNTVRLTEYSKLGLIRLNYDQYAYRGLKCAEQNVHQIHNEFSNSCPLNAMGFCNISPFQHILAIANEDGIVRIHDTNNSQKPYTHFTAHRNAIFDLIWLEDERKLVTSSGDYSSVLWDLGQAEPVSLVSMVGHKGSVRTIACKPDCNNVFASGARDGAIIQWDTRCQPSSTDVVTADKVIRYSHMKNAPNSNRTKNDKSINNPQCVTGVVYQYPEAIISCSSTDKNIKVWDSRKSYSAFKGIPTPLYTINKGLGDKHYSGYTSLVISPCRLKLYAFCTDSTIYCFNIGTYNSSPIASYNSVNGSSFFSKIRLSPDGKFLSSGSSEGIGYIWSVDNTEYLATLEGHSAEVTCVTWCKDTPLKMASCSDDGTYQIWQSLPDSDIEQTPSCSLVKYNSPKKSKFRRYFRSHVKPCLKSGMTLVELPNYIVDGETPHRSPRIKSTVESPARECDWLKKLSIRTPPLKTCRIKRTARRRSTTAKESLLKYFTKPVEASVSDR